MNDFEPRQPILTSHEFEARQVVGPNRSKQRYDVTRPSADRNPQGFQPRPRPDFNANKSRPKPAPRPAKPKGFCHDELLQTYKGQVVTLVLAASGGETDVTLIDADRYTLLVSIDGSRELIFKSALVAILVKAREA